MRSLDTLLGHFCILFLVELLATLHATQSCSDWSATTMIWHFGQSILQWLIRVLSITSYTLHHWPPAPSWMLFRLCNVVTPNICPILLLYGLWHHSQLLSFMLPHCGSFPPPRLSTSSDFQRYASSVSLAYSERCFSWLVHSTYCLPAHTVKCCCAGQHWLASLNDCLHSFWDKTKIERCTGPWP